MTFWCGSGSGCESADPDADPDPSIFIIDLQDGKKIFCILPVLFEGTFTSFSKGNKSKRSHKTIEIIVFLIIFA
jgi:hypothetical protein